jgi:hypothetical protein
VFCNPPVTVLLDSSLYSVQYFATLLSLFCHVLVQYSVLLLSYILQFFCLNICLPSGYYSDILLWIFCLPPAQYSTVGLPSILLPFCPLFRHLLVQYSAGILKFPGLILPPFGPIFCQPLVHYSAILLTGILLLLRFTYGIVLCGYISRLIVRFR